MPVMKHLNVGGTTYDTVGEASVTQVLSSGTKIATVSIDGTATDLYAPAGGSSVDPATAAPSMDGTAAVGSSAKYAREDHVHPSDTSKQATLVSGTNIKTINNESLLGSGNITIQGGSSSPYDFIVNAVIDIATNTVTSHDAVFADCADFVQAVATGQDLHAAAFCRWVTYDDEDETYSSSTQVLPLVSADTTSYGVGQYDIDGGFYLSFLKVISINPNGRASGYSFSVSAYNDDPQLGVNVSFSRT